MTVCVFYKGCKRYFLNKLKYVNIFELYPKNLLSRGVVPEVLPSLSTNMQRADKADEIDYNPFYKALQVG